MFLVLRATDAFKGILMVLLIVSCQCELCARGSLNELLVFAVCVDKICVKAPAAIRKCGCLLKMCANGG